MYTVYVCVWVCVHKKIKKTTLECSVHPMHVLRVWPDLDGRGLEEQAAHFLSLFDKYFKVLVDDGHSQQDTCTTANGT